MAFTLEQEIELRPLAAEIIRLEEECCSYRDNVKLDRAGGMLANSALAPAKEQYDHAFQQIRRAQMAKYKP